MSKMSWKGGKARVRTYGVERGPRVGLVGFLFLAGGVALAALGLVSNLRPLPRPELSRVTWVLERVGLEGGHLLLAGLLFAVVGVVLFALRSFHLLLGVDRQTAEALGDLIAANEAQTRSIDGIESLVAVLRQEVAEAHVVLRDQASVFAKREAENPLFRLAASLDQLGARIDRGILAARDTVLDELHHAAGGPGGHDMGPLFESAERVEFGLNNTAQRLEELERALYEALRPVDEVAPVAHADDETRSGVVHSTADSRCLEGPAHFGATKEEEQTWAERDSQPESFESQPLELEASAFEYVDDEELTEDEATAHETSSEDPSLDEAAPEHAEAAEPSPAGGPLFRPHYREWTPEVPLESALASLRGKDGGPLQLRFDRPMRDDEGELEITVDLDLDFVDASDDQVPAPLPAQRPEGLDLLDRLDSSRPLEMDARQDTPPLFPDLEFER